MSIRKALFISILRRLPALFALITVLPHTVFAQERVQQQAYWARVYVQHRWSERWVVHLELDERRLISPDRQLQFITHLHTHRRLSAHWDASLGSSFSIVNQIPEARLFQEGHWNYPLRKWLLIHQRFRVEQRLFRTERRWDDYRFRARYRVQLGFSVGKWVLKTSDEVMWENRYFDQNRLYFAAERLFSSHISVELGYMAYWQRRSVDYYIDRDIVRITAFFR